jgi:hypothetical protein
MIALRRRVDLGIPQIGAIRYGLDRRPSAAENDVARTDLYQAILVFGNVHSHTLDRFSEGKAENRHRRGGGHPVAEAEIEVYSAPGVPGGTITLTGRAARAYQLVQEGVLPDPNERRHPRSAEFRRERLREGTRRKYLHWLKVWFYFCPINGYKELKANPASLEAFMIYLTEVDPTRGKNRHRPGVGMSPSAMRQALAAVRSLHHAAGVEWPSTNLARDIIEVHATRRATAGVHDDEGVPPIKMPTLTELIRACPTSGLHKARGIRDRALLSMGFTTMGRRSELGYITHESLRRDADGSYRVKIPKTKTSRNGRTCFLPFWEDYPDCCPVRTLEAWLKVCRELGITSGPLFRPVDQWDNVRGAQGRGWAGPEGGDASLNGEGVELAIARAAADAVMLGAELDHDVGAYKPHGLRAGGATSSYEAGADILAIARQGGWGDRSPVIFRYIREVDMKLRNPMRLVGNRPKDKQ